MIRRIPRHFGWRSASCLLLLLTLTCVGGCKSFDTTSLPRPSWMSEKKPQYQTPTRLAVIWSDALLPHPEQPTRGFGGRIYFYNNKSEAIPVDGELVIYAYDDSQGIQPGRNPDRKFVYKADQLTQYFSEGELGASYSVWVPWDRPGNGRRDVTLVPIFTSADGSRVMGQPTKVTLPGKQGDPGYVREFPIQRSSQPLHQPVQQVAHAQPADSGQVAPGNPGLMAPVQAVSTAGQAPSHPDFTPGGQQDAPKATTIQLPPTTVQRLKASRPLPKSEPVDPTGGRPVSAGAAGQLAPSAVSPLTGASVSGAPGSATMPPRTFMPGTAGASTGAVGSLPVGAGPIGLGPVGAVSTMPPGLQTGLPASAISPPGSAASAGAHPFLSSGTATATPGSQPPAAHYAPRKFPTPKAPVERLSPDRFQR